MRIKFVHAAVPVAALAAFGLVSTASAQDDGPGVTAAAVNPEVSLATVLLGENEVGHTGHPTAQGMAVVTLNTVTGAVCTVLETEGLDEPLTGYHIHVGDPDESGPVVVDFVVNGVDDDMISKCVQSTVEQVQAIAAEPSGFYLNAHTPTYPQGAIRGQLLERPELLSGPALLPEPLRVYDSREEGETALAVDTMRTVDLTMATDSEGTPAMALPPGARAALVTLTVTETGEGGYLRIFSNALIGQPATSTINWTEAGQDIATTTTVAVDSSGKIAVAAGGSGTHFIVDVIGFYA